MQRPGAALLMSSLLLTAQAPKHIASPNASVNAMVAYPLTTSGLEKYAQASRAMSALIAKQPETLTKLKPTVADTPNTIDETVTFTKRHCPECVSTVEKTMPYRDYVLFQGGLVISYVSVVRPRASSKVRITPENMKFVLANREKIDQVLAEQRRQPAVAKQ